MEQQRPNTIQHLLFMLVQSAEMNLPALNKPLQRRLPMDQKDKMALRAIKKTKQS